MTFKSISLLSCAVAFGALMTGASMAHTPAHPEKVGNIEALSRSANLTIRGKVIKVDYTKPATSGETKGIPFTFVTYKISKTIQGKASSSSLTLRFAGGPDGQGGFVDVEGVPTFQVGDEDILFVAGNGEKGCALVECEFGRYRIADNKVFEAHGSPVESVKNGRIKADGESSSLFESFSYPAPKFDDLIQRADVKAMIKKSGLTIAQARASYQANAPKMIQTKVSDPLIIKKEGGNKTTQQPATALSVDQFMASLDAGIPAAARRAVTTVESAKMTESVATPDVKAATPPAVALSETNRVILEKPIRKD